MVSKWKEIGEALRFDEDHLDEIFTNNETDEDCLQAMIEFYFEKSDYDRIWEEIDRAIKIAKKEGYIITIHSRSPSLLHSLMHSSFLTLSHKLHLQYNNAYNASII